MTQQTAAGGRAAHSSWKRRVKHVLADRWPLIGVLSEDRDVNEGWSTPGFQAVAVARLEAWAHSEEAPRWARRPARRLTRQAYLFVRGVYGIELPHTVTLGRRVKIAHQSGIVIHQRAVIGDECVLRQNVTLGAKSRDPQLYESQAPRLGRGVSLGANAVVIGDVEVGDGAAIGPNATVMTDVPSGAVVLPPESRVLAARAPVLPTDGARGASVS